MSDDELRALRAKVDEQRAVIERIKRYFQPWLQDKRMRISGEIVLREIARIEAEEAAKAGKPSGGPE